MTIRAFVFDLDGTLADTLGDIADRMNECLASRELPTHAEKAYRRLVGNGVRELARSALPPRFRTDEALVEELARDMAARYAGNPVARTRAYPGATETLAELARLGIPFTVLSNKPDALALEVVSRLFPGLPFSAVEGQSPDRPRKPDPSRALAHAALMGVLPGEIAFVGDSDVDMRTARAAGMVALGAAWGFRDEDELRAAGAASVLAAVRDVLGFIRS